MMNLRVLSENQRTPMALLDNYQLESVVWVDRYDTVGQFEVVLPYSSEIIKYLRIDDYIDTPMSDKVMIVESIEIKTDPEQGNKFIARGRSVESILDRRIIIEQTNINTTLQAGVQTILNNEVINSRFPERNYGIVSFQTSNDPAVTTFTLNAQYYAENVLEAITNICQQAGLGFKMTMDVTRSFAFSLYAGKDRSYDQNTNRYVVFSPAFDNLLSSNYFASSAPYKNYVLVWTSPSGGLGSPLNSQVWIPAIGGGLLRRETSLEASDMSKTVAGTSNQISDAEFHNMLTQRGWEELSNHTGIYQFDGQVNMRDTYKYLTDFYLGDIVQIVDEFGASKRVQVTEMTLSEDLANGFQAYPTLQNVE